MDENVFTLIKTWINNEQLEALRLKLNHFSSIDDNLFKDFYKSKDYTKDYLEIETYTDFKKYIDDNFDINGIFLDCILYRIKKIISFVKIDVYVDYNKEKSHYIVTTNKNPLKMLGNDFWNSLSEFDYECCRFLKNAIDDEIYKKLV